jgi:hypothetical protein
MHPGEWPHMTDAQSAVSLLDVGKVLQAALLEGRLLRASPVRVLVDQDVINIKPLHEGRFHEWAERRGKQSATRSIYFSVASAHVK